MKLLNEIVELLGEQDGSLTTALLKTKVVLYKIGHAELNEWINDELNGYPADRSVPAYRVIPSRVAGDIQAGMNIYSNRPLPTAHLDEDDRKSLTSNEMRQSVRVLEEFAAKEKGHLIHPIAPELYASLSEGFEIGHVQNAWVQVEPTQIMNALIEIRSRLLDFALGLQGKLGDFESDADIRKIAGTFDARAMFKDVVIGDNATFVLGDQNSVHIRNMVKKGDFGSLAKVLRDSGVADQDITELHAAIENDQNETNQSTKAYGPAVRSWLTMMMGKAVNAAWTIELGVAGGLLSNALQAYYF